MLSHERHPGTSYMKMLSRIRVWWLKLCDRIERTVKACSICHMSLPDSHLWANKCCHSLTQRQHLGYRRYRVHGQTEGDRLHLRFHRLQERLVLVAYRRTFEVDGCCEHELHYGCIKITHSFRYTWVSRTNCCAQRSPIRAGTILSNRVLCSTAPIFKWHR